MKNYRIFSKIFLILLIIFLSFHLVIWNLYTKHIFSPNHNVGDLGRMSYIIDSLFPRNSVITINRKHMKFNDYNGGEIDLITIGDSFSNSGGGGKNTYYQDYISSLYNLKVLNIPNLFGVNNYVETISLLNNIGFLKEKKVKYILIESVQRDSINMFSKNLNFELTTKKNVLQELKNKKNIFAPKDRDIQIINNLNLNAFSYNVLYNFDDNAFFSKCYIADLKKDLFSSKNKDKLLFFKNDLKNISLETKENLIKLNDNLNILSKKLSKNNIKLYYMPAIDKYNLYSKFIINNKYPKSKYFELLRELPKKYKLVDTKKILLEELENNKKDIFYSDDTHWSYKASSVIINNIEFN